MFHGATVSLNDQPPVPAPVKSHYKWWVVFLLWFVCFFNYADRQSIFSIFPVLESEFGFTKKQLGLIGAAFMWVYAAAGPFAGWVGDQFRRKQIILGGLFFWSFVTLTTGWAHKFWHFVTIRAAEGFGEAFYFPASMSLISDYHDRRTRSRALSWHQSSVYIGTIAGGVLGGFFAEHFGWQTGFFVFGGAGMLLAPFLMLLLVEPRRGQAERPAVSANQEPVTVPVSDAPAARTPTRLILQDIFRTRTAVLLMVVFIGANFVAMSFLVWMPSFLYEKFGLRLTRAGLAATIFIQLASAIAAPAAGFIADKWSAWHPGGRMMVQAVGLLGGSSFILLTAFTLDTTILFLAMTMFGFCKGFYDSNIFASLYDVVPPRSRATAAGTMNLVGWTGGAMAPAIIGWLLTSGGKANEIQNMSRAIGFGAAIYLAGAVLLLVAIFFLAKREILSTPEPAVS